MSTFTPTELLGLPASDLNDLLDMAPGHTLVSRAAALGLDCSDPVHRAAVDRACDYAERSAQPFSPPIGAAQPGVRSDLTPVNTEAPAPTAGQDEPPGDALGLPEPDPEAAAGMAELLRESAGTGRPFMAGTFALYSDPSGAVVMVTETQGTGVRRDIIPKKMVKLALGLMGGGKRSMLGKLLGG